MRRHIEEDVRGFKRLSETLLLSLVNPTLTNIYKNNVVGNTLDAVLAILAPHKTVLLSLWLHATYTLLNNLYSKTTSIPGSKSPKIAEKWTVIDDNVLDGCPK